MVFSLVASAMAMQGAVVIKYAPPVGSTVRYRMQTSVTMGMPGQPSGGSSGSTAELTLKVLSRSGNRTTVESTTGKMKLTGAAGMSPEMRKQAESQGSNVKMVAVMDVTGAVLSAKSSGKSSNPMAAGMGQGLTSAMQGLAFPNRAVKVGESWKTTFDMGKFMRAAGPQMLPPGMTVSGVMPITTKLVGVRTQGGKTLANLSFTMVGTMTMGMQGQKFATKLNTTGNAWIEAGTGVMHSVKSSATSTTNFGGRSLTQKVSNSITKI